MIYFFLSWQKLSVHYWITHSALTCIYFGVSRSLLCFFFFFSVKNNNIFMSIPSWKFNYLIFLYIHDTQNIYSIHRFFRWLRTAHKQHNKWNIRETKTKKKGIVHSFFCSTEQTKNINITYMYCFSTVVKTLTFFS